MTKFNQNSTIKIENKSGHSAYSMPAKSKLVTQVLTSFFNEKKFYGDNSAEMQETIKEVISTDPVFIAKLAVFARREFNMRSVSHILTAYLAHEVQGKPYTREVVKGVSLRGDDLTEIMACHLSIFGKPVPNSLKKGINDVLQGLDEYALAKYKGKGKSVKMRDLFCLCRPTPKNEEQSALWKRLLNDELGSPYTWETELSKNGNNAETWEQLIDSGKVGYMALLRNLRNIIKSDPSNVQKVLDVIQNPEMVKRSKQLPFRYLSAYKALGNIGDSRVFAALENAIEASIENMPELDGTTVIAVDTSGSMTAAISAKSTVRCYEIAMVLGRIANKICENSIFYSFDTDIKKHAVSHKTSVLEAASKVPCGWGTNMELPFAEMLKNNIKADRIIIISDNEVNNRWKRKPVQAIADEYRKKINPELWVHAIDLQGYGTQQFCGDKTNIIAGWSEKVLSFIKLAEQGEGGIVKAIEEYTF